MSESTASPYKRATWLLLVGLIAVCALGYWYVGSLHRRLAQQDARIGETTQQLKSETDAEQELRTQLAAAKEQLQSTTQRHETAAAQLAQYQQELAAAAGREQGLNARLASIAAEHEGKVASLNQAMAEAGAKWGEQVRVYRIALEGTEPQRAALMTRLEQRATEEHAALEQATAQNQAALAQAEQERKAAEAQLSDRLAQAQRKVDEEAQALAAAAADKTAQEALLAEANGKAFALTEETQSQRDTLAALEQKYERTLADQRTERDQAAAALAAVQTQLSDAQAAATLEKQALEEQLKTAQLRIAQLEADLKSAQASYEQTLTAAQLKVEQARVEAREQGEQALAAERLKAEQALAAERAAKATALTQARGLQARYTELKAQQTERGALVNLSDDQLHFPTRSAVLPKGQNPGLDRLGAMLVEYPNLSVRIEGYTDNAGADDANLTLSKARAEAVRQALIERGVAAARLSAEGFGKQRPIAENATGPGRRKNRRVEVYLIEMAP